MAKFDETDEKILALLEAGEIRIQSISDRIGLSVGAVHNRIQKLKSAGMGYKIDFDYRPLGKLPVFLLLDILYPFRKEIENSLKRETNVKHMYRTTGPYNLIVFAVFDNVDQLREYALVTLGYDKRVRKVDILEREK